MNKKYKVILFINNILGMDSVRLPLMEELPENNTTRNLRIIFLKGYL